MPEDEINIVRLATAERVIQAFETFAAECEARDMPKFTRHITDCVEKLQGEYVAFLRQLDRAGKRPSDPTEH